MTDACKTLPCHKLCLRTVIKSISNISNKSVIHEFLRTQSDWCSRRLGSLIWWNNCTEIWTFNNLHPETDGTTCCTTGLWLSHTSLSVDSKINPLSLCVVQSQGHVYLWTKKKLVLPQVTLKINVSNMIFLLCCHFLQWRIRSLIQLQGSVFIKKLLWSEKEH